MALIQQAADAIPGMPSTTVVVIRVAPSLSMDPTRMGEFYLSRP